MNGRRNLGTGSLLQFFLLAALGVSLPVMAQTTVEKAWVRATVPGQPSTGAFMKVTSTDDAKLVEVRSDVARSVQIHRSTMQHEVMRMEPVENVPLPPGKMVSFDPDGYHVMLMDLKAQIRAGDVVPLVLVVQTPSGAQELIPVRAEARPLDAADASK
ncbi:copper chaperone PCu(A)C [Pseudomonas sp. NPDC090203]|uniref:copper chaperone PCu(A)C n=1 Tax=Pseudomonas sp. NPDC090203 TaxID=3364477 RepID=UPI003826A61B